MPTPRKHLIVIHGRATKPSQSEKRRLIKESVLHGLERISAPAAKKVRESQVKLSAIYYGDINNQEMVKAGKKTWRDLPGRDPAFENARCEKSGSYDTDLELLFARTVFTKAAYKAFLKEQADKAALDNVASAVSGLFNLLGLSETIIKKATPDMGAYLTTRVIGSQVRERLQKVLLPSLKRGDDICLISHSMGCIVSYDVLWKFSRMSEYKTVREKKLKRWITIGNPLGEPGVKDNLYDANERKDGKYPTNIDTWINVAAKDDFVAHDEDIKDDFEAMIDRGLIKKNRVIDREIYNFWAGDDGSNPHKLYGYLDHPDVAEQIVEWMDA